MSIYSLAIMQRRSQIYLTTIGHTKKRQFLCLMCNQPTLLYNTHLSEGKRYLFILSTLTHSSIQYIKQSLQNMHWPVWQPLDICGYFILNVNQLISKIQYPYTATLFDFLIESLKSSSKTYQSLFLQPCTQKYFSSLLRHPQRQINSKFIFICMCSMNSKMQRCKKIKAQREFTNNFMLEQQFSTGVLQEFLKHAISDYLVRDTDLFSLRMSKR